MSKLPVTLACYSYDRTRALIDGRVVPEGIDLNYLILPNLETFFRQLRHREFAVSEISLSSYVIEKSRDDPFVALPVFVSRFFRHSCIYVNAHSGIETPADLIGKRVGTPEYEMTAGVWIRGALADDYGVPVAGVRYFTGGLDEPGRPEKLALRLPPEISVTPVPAEKTLGAMLEAGEIDALYTARIPGCFRRGSPHVRRLFPDYQAVEQDYFRRTALFPIMHAIAIRRDVYERDPWIAGSLYKAFVAAQRLAYADLTYAAALVSMLPWSVAAAEEVTALMGDDFWPYGLEKNVHALETFLRYHHEQGLSPRRYAPEELFAPETLESFKN